MPRDNEAVYDAQIAPLMSQIIAICKEHEIPMIATFQLTDVGTRADETPLGVSTLLFHRTGDLHWLEAGVADALSGRIDTQNNGH